MRFSSEWADHEAGAGQVPIVPVDMQRIEHPTMTQATWIGHSTYLIQANGVNILTDPVFSIEPPPSPGLDRSDTMSPAIPVEALPPIDYVVISHNHYDHLDLPSIEAIGNDALWLVPLKNREALESVGVTNVVELDWWETHEVGSGNSQRLLCNTGQPGASTTALIVCGLVGWSRQRTSMPTLQGIPDTTGRTSWKREKDWALLTCP